MDNLLNPLYINTGILFLVLYIFLKIFYKNNAICEIEKNLDTQEYLICDITPIIYLDFVFAFLFGYAFSQIVSINNLNSIHNFFSNYDNISFFTKAIFTVFEMTILNLLASNNIFITNRRIIFESCFLNGFANNQNEILNAHFNDIKKCREQDSILGKKFVIRFKSTENKYILYKINTPCYTLASKAIRGIHRENTSDKLSKRRLKNKAQIAI